MKQNTQKNELELNLVEVQEAWASRIINVLLTELERGKMETPQGFMFNGVAFKYDREHKLANVAFQFSAK